MKSLLMTEVAQGSGGRLLRGRGDAKALRIHTDTRSLRPGDCFVALKGDRFNAHDFLADVPATGAVGAMISETISQSFPEEFALVQVPDTLKALQDLSLWYRRQLPIRIVGVTGSSGKTSTKEMIAAVLRQKFRTPATQGNLNNHIGVPLTLLGFDTDDERGVVEMGMNHPGEIAPLARLAEPEVGVITNIGVTHIEFFGEQRGIAQEKSELIAALPETGLAVLNADDKWTATIRARTRARVVTAGFSESADWRARNCSITAEGIRFVLSHGKEEIALVLPYFSRPMVTNALMAAAAGHFYGLTFPEIVEGLKAVKLPGNRMQMIQRYEGWIMNDAYNANPDSMKAALHALHEFPAPGRRIAVMGSMGELGSHAPQLHLEVGAEAASIGFDWIIGVGPHAEDYRKGVESARPSQSIMTFAETAAAGEFLKKELKSDDSILLKGSRFMKLEAIIPQIQPGEAR